MKKVLNEYKGVCLFYLLIVLAIFIISVNNNKVNAKYNNVSSYSEVI